MNLREDIRIFINASLLKVGKGPVQDYSQALISSKMIDSILFVELILYLDDKYELKSTSHGFKKEKFESINEIASMIEAK